MSLSKDQRIEYLSNILHIATIDGQLSPIEKDIIAKIKKRIGAKKSELNKAEILIETPNFKVCPVGYFSDKVQNLQDIIYILMIRGNLNEASNVIIKDFARDIDLAQGHIDAIFQDVDDYIRSETGAISCPNCNTSIQGKMKFCPQCGVSIRDADKEKSVSITYEIPRSGISIEFAESTAGSFSHALKSAQAAPINASAEKGKKTWYMASWPAAGISEIAKLAENLKGLRNRKVHIDGVEARWDDVFGFVWCYEQRGTSYKPGAYCFGLEDKCLNIWGCKQTGMDWEEWADWFGYGTFNKTGIKKKKIKFAFDKERIKHQLKTNLHRCRFCPHLSMEFIETIVDVLPDEVTPSDNGPWRYKRDHEGCPGAIKVKATVGDDEYRYVDEFYSAGVVPASINVGLELLKNVLRTDINISDEVRVLIEGLDNM